MSRSAPVSLACALFLAIIAFIAGSGAGRPAAASPSLQSYSGIWQMPSARVLPDWHLRAGYGSDQPYHYYGVALGVFDRLEFHGQFTRTDTITAFPGRGYGDHKDRSAGLRLALKKEERFWPQVALGVFDATGTALFGSRYLVASKQVGKFDFTLGLGQGVLAGEYVPDLIRGSGRRDQAFSFLTSSVFSAKTRPFAGLEYQLSPRLTLAAEYSSLDYANMFGVGRRGPGGDRPHPFNLGLKYRPHSFWYLQLAHLGGEQLAGSVGVQFPLEPEGLLVWRRAGIKPVGERERGQVQQAAHHEMAVILGRRLEGEGFTGVAVSVSEEAVWLEAVNTIHLSDSRALGRMAAVAEALLPPRITVFYLNLKNQRTIDRSLRVKRVDLRDFMAGTLAREPFLAGAGLEMSAAGHWHEFQGRAEPAAPYHGLGRRFSWAVEPRLHTLVNDVSGFLRIKALVEGRGRVRLWPGANLVGALELPLANDFKQSNVAPLEPEATRTDWMLYAEKDNPRLTALALEHNFALPAGIMARAGAGIFESAYAGAGGEIFRYFGEGRWGLGLEAAAVRKRHLERNFALHPEQRSWYTSGFLNLYALLWPQQGLEGGLKLGRFLAGDPGARFELRRSFKYFTVGAWYTVTDTGRFSSELNRGHREQGVYLRFPLAVFKDSDLKRHLRLVMTGFSRDPGHVVRQPGSLYPLDPWSSLDHTRRTLEDMRSFARPRGGD